MYRNIYILSCWDLLLEQWVSFSKVFHVLRFSIPNSEQMWFCLEVLNISSIIQKSKIHSATPGLFSSARCLPSSNPWYRVAQTCSCPSTWNPSSVRWVGLIKVQFLLCIKQFCCSRRREAYDQSPEEHWQGCPTCFCHPCTLADPLFQTHLGLSSHDSGWLAFDVATDIDIDVITKTLISREKNMVEIFVRIFYLCIIYGWCYLAF